MSLKTQVKALLKSKFSGVQLSNERVDAIAKWVDGKTEKEDEIDGLLDQFNEINPVADLAKQDDRIRTLEAQAKSKGKEEEKPGEKKEEEEKKDEDDPMKALLEELRTLKTDIQSIKKDKTVTSYKSKAAEALKEIPEKLRNQVLVTIEKMSFENDEEFDTYISDWTGSVEGIKEVTFGKDKPNGGFGGGNNKEASATELDAVFGNIKI